MRPGIAACSCSEIRIGWRTSCKPLIGEAQRGYLAGMLPMNQIMRQAKKALGQRREALMRIWRQTSDEERQVSGAVETDWTDVASDKEVAEILHALSDKERREFEEIEAALARLADGSYGLCLRCGRAIGRQRLMAIPEAGYCLECSA